MPTKYVFLQANRTQGCSQRAAAVAAKRPQTDRRGRPSPRTGHYRDQGRSAGGVARHGSEQKKKVSRKEGTNWTTESRSFIFTFRWNNRCCQGQRELRERDQMWDFILRQQPGWVQNYYRRQVSYATGVLLNRAGQLGV